MKTGHLEESLIRCHTPSSQWLAGGGVDGELSQDGASSGDLRTLGEGPVSTEPSDEVSACHFFRIAVGQEVGSRKKIPGPNTESLRKFSEVHDSDVSLTAFDSADIVAVQSGFKPEILL